MIIFFGIPHGAIDHILYAETKKMSQGVFYFFYFGTMAVYLGLWIYLPVICLILFLFLSAYHFGQSQFAHSSSKIHFSDYILYTAWGVSVLSALFLYNHSELFDLLKTYPDTLVFKVIFDKGLLLGLLVVSTPLSLMLILRKTFSGEISTADAIEEIVILLSIHIAFLLLPLILGFTLYFVIMHSLKVVLQEFDYLSKIKKIKSITHFIGLLLPNTLVSIAAAGLFFYLHFNGFFSFSLNLMLFVMISLITLPHAFVMDKFYTKTSD